MGKGGENLRVLYISYDGILEPLGQSQILSYLQGLNSSGIHFFLLSFEKKGFLDRGCLKQTLHNLSQKNIRWRRLRYHKNPPVLSTLFDVARGLGVSLFYATRYRIQVVHARGYTPALIAFLLKKILKVRFIFDMRGFWADEKAEVNHLSKSGIVYKITKYFENLFLKDSDEAVVLTRKAKKIIEDDWGYKIALTVIPCCVDTGFFRPNYTNCERDNFTIGKFIFVHTGSLEDWYMRAEMLDYFKVAKEIIPQVHFSIITQSPKERLTDLIRKKGLKKEDFTITSASFSQMPIHLSDVDAAFLFLSLDFSKAGCLPTKFAEFLSCGIPIIASPGIGDTEDLILKNRLGVIINSFEDREYRRSFFELLKLKTDRQLEVRCREVAEKEFSLKLGIDSYAGIYSRIGNDLSG